MSRPKQNSREIKFTILWNERYFHQDPRYRPFSKLYVDGGDFDYIDFLCDTAALTELIRASVTLNAAALRASRKRAAPKIPPKDVLHPILSIYGAMVIQFTVSRIEEAYHCNAMLSPEQRRQILKDAALAAAAWSFERIKQANEKPAASINEPAQLSSHPILTLFDKYRPPNPFKKGNRQDHWGSLFMLAITEHLREQTSKPHHAEAYRLLRAVRKQAGLENPRPANKALKNTAATRIENLKRSHPDWPQDLSLLRDAYDLAKTHSATPPKLNQIRTPI